MPLPQSVPAAPLPHLGLYQAGVEALRSLPVADRLWLLPHPGGVEVVGPLDLQALARHDPVGGRWSLVCLLGL